MKRFRLLLAVSCVLGSSCSHGAEPNLREEVSAAMRKAASFFRSKVAAHGGYVFYYSLDLTQRWGEGETTTDQIFVQPPGTPAVGLAYLKAFAATGDAFFLDAAREAAEALVHGQLESGGWTQAIDFDPHGAKAARYRRGQGSGRNFSSLDDGTTQSALSFLMQTDRALKFEHAPIHQAAESARAALLAAQHPSGGFPQGWEKPAPEYVPVPATFPTRDWRTEGRIKNYWDMPTLNDNLCSYVARTLEDGWEIYKDERCRAALGRLGDFLRLAQMPEPQPGWAQQYDWQMQPIWARKFEPPALAGRESQDAIETLLEIHYFTRDAKYLEPIPRALAWLGRSLLPDGRLARYYELETNKPLYMTVDYHLTYDDADLPAHYGWKTSSRVKSLEKAWKNAAAGKPAHRETKPPDKEEVRHLVRELDSEGRWLSTYSGQTLVGQPKFPVGLKFISSEVFSANLNALSEHLAEASKRRVIE